jgi:hypothetical protein
VAARSLKVFTLTVKVIAVGRGRQRAFWLLHLSAARRVRADVLFGLGGALMAAVQEALHD